MRFAFESNLPCGLRKAVGVLTPACFGYNRPEIWRPIKGIVGEEGGLTPFEALQTATGNPPSFFDMEEVIGTVASVKIADLVLLDGNPLEHLKYEKSK